MNKIGFDSDKYLAMQTERIRERIARFGDKLYLEFGGKLFDDFHAARVLPGFKPDNKLVMLSQLKDMAEVVIVINAADIAKNKLRADLGITYDADVLRLIDIFRAKGLYVGSVVLARFVEENTAAALFQKRLEALETESAALDTFRRRAGVIGFRAGMLANVLTAGETKANAAFARWVADTVLDEQCALFGRQLEEQAAEEPGFPHPYGGEIKIEICACDKEYERNNGDNAPRIGRTEVAERIAPHRQERTVYNVYLVGYLAPGEFEVEADVFIARRQQQRPFVIEYRLRVLLQLVICVPEIVVDLGRCPLPCNNLLVQCRGLGVFLRAVRLVGLLQRCRAR